MTRKTLLALVAAAALAGCNSNGHTITGGQDNNNNSTNEAANAQVTLPPAIAATKLYRCSGDNSVVQVDWLADNKTANVRLGENGAATQVVAPEAGKPMAAADGLTVSGAASGSSISVKLPSGATKSCHV
jgi:putative VirB-like lipoprotein